VSEPSGSPMLSADLVVLLMEKALLSGVPAKVTSPLAEKQIRLDYLSRERLSCSK
jgi:hypothetical protein